MYTLNKINRSIVKAYPQKRIPGFSWGISGSALFSITVHLSLKGSSTTGVSLRSSLAYNFYDIKCKIMNGKRAPKSFLRKGSGLAGQIMKRINYPMLTKANIQRRLQSSVTVDDGITRTDSHSDIKNYCRLVSKIWNNNENRYSVDEFHFIGLSAIGENGVNSNSIRTTPILIQQNERTNRPLTSGTTDSGFRDDERGSVFLSPDSNVDNNVSNALCIVDVSRTISGNSSTSVSTGAGSQSIPLCIVDLSDINKSQETVVSNKQSNEGNRKLDANSRSVVQNRHTGDSTIEFEQIEKQFDIDAAFSKSFSDISSRGTDGAASRHWRQIFQEFKNDKTPSSTSSSSDKSEISPQIHEYENGQKLRQLKLHDSKDGEFSPIRESARPAFQSDSHMIQRCGSSNDHISARFNAAKINHLNRPHPLLLGKSADEELAVHREKEMRIQNKQSKYTQVSQNDVRFGQYSTHTSLVHSLAMQLRDLIAHVDITAEENRLKMKESGLDPFVLHYLHFVTTISIKDCIISVYKVYTLGCLYTL
ncbi:unnamed protein product [Dracunculus medinensis]|uniref:GIT domain-containing protein n=1 Tax=Dracunculus medinensis TaxID=318479 RepID=A0A158Q4Z6_DRAME|nr:unnamed protein product [Dracunculus medinensis]